MKEKTVVEDWEGSSLKSICPSYTNIRDEHFLLKLVKSIKMNLCELKLIEIDKFKFSNKKREPSRSTKLSNQWLYNSENINSLYESYFYRVQINLNIEDHTSMNIYTANPINTLQKHRVTEYGK